MISRMKKPFIMLLAAMTALPLLLIPPPSAEVAAANQVIVNLADEKQVIRGFGGMNHPIWTGADLTPAQRDTAFGNGQNQLGFSILRIYINDDRTQWYREVNTAKRAIEHGAIVFASPWNPPSSMVETFTLGRSQGNGTTYEAETGTSRTNATTANTNSGYSGSGYVDFQAATGAAIQWNNIIIGSTGTKNFKFRYAQQSGTRYLDIYVNGTKVLSNVAFEATGSGTTWSHKSVQIPITTTGSNSLRLVTTGTGGPSIDNVNATPYVEEANAKRLKYDRYDDYAQHLNDFDAYMKANGVNLYAISVQNEPDYAHDWTWWTPEEILRFMKENAGSINNRVIAPESFSYVKESSDLILNDPLALANMDILGAHTYGTQYQDFPYPLFKEKGAGKELWMTEVYYPNSQTESANRWPESLDVAQHIHHSMVDAEFQAYVWWYIRRTYSPILENGTISKRGYNMAHFSKFVRPGYVRVEATKNPDPQVYASAYKGDNKVIIVAINKGTSAISESFILQNASATSVSSWITDSSRNLAAGAPISLANQTFTAVLPAQSVTTFVVESAPQSSNGTVYEAETGTTLTNAAVQSSATGFNGAGFVDFQAASGAAIEWSSIQIGFAGNRTVKIRYALQSGTRNLDVFVNGTKVIENAAFEATGSWSTWAEKTIQVPMSLGSNTFKLATTGSEGPNIDSIAIMPMTN